MRHRPSSTLLEFAGLLLAGSLLACSSSSSPNADGAIGRDSTTSEAADSRAQSADAGGVSADARSTSDAVNPSTDTASTLVDATSLLVDAASTPADAVIAPPDATSLLVDATSTPADAVIAPPDASNLLVDAASTPADAVIASSDASNLLVDAPTTPADGGALADAVSPRLDAAATLADAVSPSMDAAAMLVDARDSAEEGGNSNADATMMQHWGINTNLGDPVDNTGTPLPSDFNPLGSKISRIYSFKEIATTGLFNTNHGSGPFNFVLDSDTTNTFTSSPLYSEDANSNGNWAMWPHASTAADLSGTGRQEVVTVIFTPTNTTTGVVSNSPTQGTAKLRILSYNGTSYSTRFITIAGTFSLYIGEMENQYYAMSIAAGDVNGDGMDEIAVAIGNTITFLSVDLNAGTSTALIPAAIDMRARDTSFGYEFHPTTLAAGDLTGDGKAEFVVADGADKGATYKAKYWVYSWNGSQMASLDSGYVANASKSEQHCTVAIGDIDNDGQNEVIFAGDDDESKYVLLAAEWSQGRLVFYDVVATGGFNSYDWSYNRSIALKTFRYYSQDTSGNLVRSTALYCHDSVVAFDSTIGFTRVANIGHAPRRFTFDVGDVNRDHNDEIVFADDEGQERLMVYGRTSAGAWGLLNVALGTYADLANNDASSIALADLRGESDALKYVDRSLRFSNPQVVAVLASVPYYTAYPDNNGNCYTEFGGTKATSTDTTHTFSVNAGVSIGASVEAPLWGSAASAEAKTTITANFTASISSSTEQSITKIFVDYAGQDQVIFTSIPYDSYHFLILKPSGSPVDYYINIPRSPQLIVKERSDFNALPNNPVQIGSTVLPHTIGVPTSYPSKVKIQTMFAGSKGMWDAQGTFFTNSAAGGLQVELSQSNTEATTLGGGFSIEQEYQVVVATALFGTQFGFSYDFAYTVSTTATTIVGATMPYLPASAPSSLAYQSGIAAYTTALAGQSPKIWVVNFWVN